MDRGSLALALVMGIWSLVAVRRSARSAAVKGQFTWPAPDMNAELQKLMNQAPIAYFELDESGRFTFVNEKEAQLRGLPVSELLEKYLWDLEPLSLQLRVREETLRKLGGSRVVLPYERNYQRADGRILTLETHEVLRYDRLGKTDRPAGSDTRSDRTRQNPGRGPADHLGIEGHLPGVSRSFSARRCRLRHPGLSQS